MKHLVITFLFTLFSNVYANQVQVSSLEELTFTASTNIPGVEIEGSLEEDAKIQNVNKMQKVVLELSKLSTGISLRDEHMRELIFKGINPSFEGEVHCSTKDSCFAKGKLQIAGTFMSFSLPVKKSGDEYKLEHIIKLTDFSIKAPEFMGVRVENEITIHATFR